MKNCLHIAPSTPKTDRGARKTAKPSKIKARSSQPCTNCSLYRCAYDVHNYDAQQHRVGQIISPLTLQTITITDVVCWREGVKVLKETQITDFTLSSSAAGLLKEEALIPLHLLFDAFTVFDIPLLFNEADLWCICHR